MSDTAQKTDASSLSRLLNVAIGMCPLLLVIHRVRQYTSGDYVLRVLFMIALLACALVLLRLVTHGMALMEKNPSATSVLRRSSVVVWSLLLQASVLAAIPQREVREEQVVENVGAWRGMSTRRRLPVMELGTADGTILLNVDDVFVERLSSIAQEAQIVVWEFDSTAVYCLGDEGVAWSLQEYNSYHKWTGWRYSIVVLLILVGYLMLTKPGRHPRLLQV